MYDDGDFKDGGAIAAAVNMIVFIGLCALVSWGAMEIFV